MSSHAPCGDKPGPDSNKSYVLKVLNDLKVLKVLKVPKALNKKINFKKSSIRPEKLIRHSGNYRKLLSYQKTTGIA